MQLNLFTPAPSAPPTSQVTSRWVGTYHVCKGTTRKLHYYRFYWQIGDQTNHVHIPGGSINSPTARHHSIRVQAMIDSGESIEEILREIRSMSAGRGSNLNRRRSIG